MSLLLSLALLSSAAASVPPAGQDNQADAARIAFAEGRLHFERGEYEQALASFEHAHAEKPLPAFFFNMAQCHYHLKHYGEAVALYERYLAEEPNADATRVQARIAEARRAQSRANETARSSSTSRTASLEMKNSRAPAAAAETARAASATSLATDDGDDVQWLVTGIASGVLLTAAAGTIAYVALERPELFGAFGR